MKTLGEHYDKLIAMFNEMNVKINCISTILIYLFEYINIYILTSNQNATAKLASIFEGYIEYTFTEDFVVIL